MLLVVHRLLPTNRRNHRCRRCHTARRSVQIRRIDPQVVRSSSSPSTSALVRATAQHCTVPFRERSRVRADNYAVDAVDAVFSHTVPLQTRIPVIIMMMIIIINK